MALSVTLVCSCNSVCLCLSVLMLHTLQCVPTHKLYFGRRPNTFRDLYWLLLYEKSLQLHTFSAEKHMERVSCLMHVVCAVKISKHTRPVPMSLSTTLLHTLLSCYKIKKSKR